MTLFKIQTFQSRQQVLQSQIFNASLIVHAPLRVYTGWSILFCLILTSWYDKNNICMKKIVVGICSVYRDILSKTDNQEIQKLLHSKKLNLKICAIFTLNQLSILRLLEASIGTWVSYYMVILKYNFIFPSEADRTHQLMDFCLLHNYDFSRFYSFS